MLALIVSILILIGSHGDAAEEQVRIGPRVVRANHLEPISPYDPSGYDQAVFRSLIGEDLGQLWMVVKPSFSPEYAIVLRQKVKLKPTTDPFAAEIESEKWTIEFVEAKKQIWRSEYLDRGRLQLDINVTHDVVRHHAEVPDVFAKTIAETWESVLKQTRYPIDAVSGFDGVTYQFYSKYGFYGETWTPSTGVPLMMTELGLKLGEIAKASDKQRAQLISESQEIAKKIDAAISHPSEPVER
ncbi:hypothetical protein BH11VER1_BH11VER1_33630 [soil metagenome]